MEFFRWALTRTGQFDYKLIRGIRAPYLGVNVDYFKALKVEGYKWDSSMGGKRSTVHGIREIPIRAIPVVGAFKHKEAVALPFDYDFSMLNPKGVYSSLRFYRKQ